MKQLFQNKLLYEASKNIFALFLFVLWKNSLVENQEMFVQSFTQIVVMKT